MEHTPATIPAPKDPFGRIAPSDGSQERLSNLGDVNVLEAPVGPTDENRPDDVARVEFLLDQAGLLNLKETEGVTGFYGERLRQAINALQRQSGLAQNGRIVPDDPTHAALRNHPTNTASGDTPHTAR